MSTTRLLRGVCAALAALAAAPASAATYAYITSRSTNVVDIVDIATNTIVATLPTGTTPLGVAARPDGREVYITNNGSDSVTVIRATHRTVVATIPVCSQPMGVAFTPDGSRAYVACNGSNNVAVIDTATRTITATLPAYGAPTGVDVSAGGDLVMVGNSASFAGGEVPAFTIYDTATHVPLERAPSSVLAFGVEFADDVGYAYMTGQAQIWVVILPFVTQPGGRTMPGEGRDLAADEVRHRIYYASAATGSLVTVNGQTVQQAATTPVGIEPYGVDMTPDGSRIYVTNGGSGTVSVVDANTLQVVATFPVSPQPASLGRFILTPPAPVPPPSPTGVSAVAGDERATVTFTASAGDGDGTISGYRATCGTRSVTGTASPLVVTGLTNRVTVTCTVAAINEAGTGAESSPSNSVTPDGPPTTPVITDAVRGNTQVVVHFTAGPNNNASPTTSYTATCGSATNTLAASPIAVGGLANGVPVTCTVRAHNVVGDSPTSAPSASVTPATVPGAPTLQSATAGDGNVVIAFDGPASNGGEPVSSYTARCGTSSQSGTASPITVSGLTNGQAYTCTVAAINDVGTGAASNGATATPRLVADVSITVGNGADYVQGGEPIDYLIEVINHGSGTVTGARVRDTLDAEFGPATWACSGDGGGVCPTPPTGNGNVDALVALPGGARVSFLLTTSVPPLPELPVSNTATVTVPNSVDDPVPANDSATDGPDARVLFRSGFE